MVHKKNNKEEIIERKNYSKTFRIVFSSFMLVLMIITNIVSNFFPFSFLNINITFVFIFYCFYISGFAYGMLIILINFFIAPFLSFGWGLTPVFLFGQIVLNLSNFIFLIIFRLLIGKNIKYEIKVKSFILITSITTLATAIIMTTLNILLFIPIFFYIIDPLSFPYLNFIDFSKQYQQSTSMQIFFFGIPNYYLASFTLLFSFNILQYSIISILLLSVLKIPKNINLY
ncbi:MAG: MPN527 family putative ECF transporter permease subunit [Metamycoplasmataceae bacterium]